MLFLINLANRELKTLVYGRPHPIFRGQYSLDTQDHFSYTPAMKNNALSIQMNMRANHENKVTDDL